MKNTDCVIYKNLKHLSLNVKNMQFTKPVAVSYLVKLSRIEWGSTFENFGEEAVLTTPLFSSIMDYFIEEEWHSISAS